MSAARAAATECLASADRHLNRYAKTSEKEESNQEKEYFRAETLIKVTKFDEQTHTEYKEEKNKVLGFFESEEKAKKAVKDYHASLNVVSDVPEVIHSGSDGNCIQVQPLLTQVFDTTEAELRHLKKENKILKRKVYIRSTLLEKLRCQYMRDIVLVKEQVLCAEAKKKAQTLAPDNFVDDALKFQIPASKLPSLRGLPQNVLQTMLPRFDLRDSMPVFAPDNVLLAVTPCHFCGGSLDAISFDEKAVKSLRDNYVKLQEAHKETCKRLKQFTGALHMMQKKLRESQDESTSATATVSRLRANIRRLLDTTAEEWLQLHSKEKAAAKHREDELWKEKSVLQKMAEHEKKLADAARKEATERGSSLDAALSREKDAMSKIETMCKKQMDTEDELIDFKGRLRREIEVREASEAQVHKLKAELMHKMQQHSQFFDLFSHQDSHSP